MKKNIIFITLVGITQVLTFYRWSSCWLFQNDFYFTFQNLSTQLLTASNEEKGLPILLIRLLHNKVTGLLWGVSQTFLQYIDIRFLIALLGIAGALGAYMGFWYFFTKHPKNRILWKLVIFLFVFSLIEMVFMPHIDFSKRIIPLWVVLGIFSIFGVEQFLRYGKKKIRGLLILTLIILTLCALFLFPNSLYGFCLKI